MRTVRIFISLVLVFVLLFNPVIASSSLVDKIFQKYMESGPSYFESQKRGYFTFGSFSGRYDYGTLHPISISMPSINLGCGGIDIFLGGFGFTGLDYLVQKFQRLIQMAPAVAFHIALNTISPQLRGIITEIESIITLLNQLQLDECKILKPFMAINLREGDISSQFEGAAKQALSSTGLDKLWTSVSSAFKSLGNTLTGGGSSNIPDMKKEVRESIKMCPSLLRSLVDDLENNRRGCLVEKFVRENRFRASNIGPLGNDLIRVVRGLVGDVCVRRHTGGSDDKLNPYYLVYIAPCEGAFVRLKEGELMLADNIDYVNKRMICSSGMRLSELQAKIESAIRNAYVSYRTGSRPPNDYLLLVDRSPFSLHKLMEYAVISGDPSLPLSTASYHAALILFNLISSVQAEIYSLKHLLEKEVGSQPSYADCPIIQINEALANFSKERVNMVSDEIYKLLALKSKELYYIVGLVNNFFNFYTYMERKLISEFGPVVANRVLARR